MRKYLIIIIISNNKFSAKISITILFALLKLASWSKALIATHLIFLTFEAEASYI